MILINFTFLIFCSSILRDDLLTRNKDSMNISESEIMLLRYFLIMYNQNEKKKKDILKIIIKNFQS
ncbi:hypothetical protein A0H76_2997, partial [Hepatospora eriocheir]